MGATLCGGGGNIVLTYLYVKSRGLKIYASGLEGITSLLLRVVYER